MLSDPGDAAHLWDMLDAARAIQGFIAGKKAEDYLQDRMLRGALERYLEIIGEAARRVSEPYRTSHSETPWRRIIGLRNILAHDYGEIKHERIWELAAKEITGLVLSLVALVPSSE